MDELVGSVCAVVECCSVAHSFKHSAMSASMGSAADSRRCALRKEVW